MAKPTIVLAYSGGLDTSVIVKWLAEEYDARVVAYVADVGQDEDFAAIEKKAKATGAASVYISDLKKEFLTDFVFPAIRANAVYEGSYLLGTSLARPVIAKEHVRIARAENATMVAHGATGKGNDQVRFELTFAALAPDLQVIAPWREWTFGGRSDLLKYAKKHGIPVTSTAEKPYSIDENIYHTSHEGGILEDPDAEPPADVFSRTTAPEDAPDTPAYITIGFEKGNPVAVNGTKRGPLALVQELNSIGGAHGIGRVDIVENRYVGMKSRGVYETPGGTLLLTAHRALETLTVDREAFHLKESLMPRYAELVYYGYWFSPEREAIQALVDSTQRTVTGEVRLKLYKGAATVVGRSSPESLYDTDLVTFEEDDSYNQADATGFIRLSGLRLKTAAAGRNKK